MKLTVSPYPYNNPPAGTKAELLSVEKYTLCNDNGMEADIITYGATVTGIRVPDKNGTVENVVVSLDTLDDYITHGDLCLGGTVGRFAGRISNAAFTMDGITYRLPKNDGENSLHGNGEFSTAVWQASPFKTETAVGVTFTYISPDGSNGFPGKVTAGITYTLDNTDTLSLLFLAEAEQKTVLNLTNHTYFNLSGNLKRNIKDHLLTAAVNQVPELRPDCIFTGKEFSVEGTPFDFRTPAPLRNGIDSSFPQNVAVHDGYDHPFLFPEESGGTVILEDPESGRRMTLQTDYPCFVMYSGNYMDGSATWQGIPICRYAGVALEAQGVPDAVNHPEYPSVVLEAFAPYRHKTTWTFSR